MNSIGKLNQINKHNKSNIKEKQVNIKTDNVWALGNYQSISTMLPQISAHLTRLTNIQQGESVLDVACGNGNTAITARRKGAKVTGIDNTPELLSLAVEEERTAQVSGIEWKEGDAQNLPFEDGSFDVVVSTFGHMFAPNPELAAKEIVRVTRKGGRIGFATWPPELAIGSIFRTNAKHLPKKPNSPPSPILWGIPEVVEKRLIDISQIYFERGTVTFPILSPNHFWEHMSKKYGPLIKSIEVLKNLNDPNEPESLRNDFLKVIDPYVIDNGIRLGYLLTIARK